MTEDTILSAVSNSYPEENFVVGDRTFPYHDLPFDDYIAFIKNAKPIAALIAEGLRVDEPTQENTGGLGFDPFQLDFDKMIDMCGKELPHLAWLCIKQSDSKMTIAKVKDLAKRPQPLLEAVIGQIRHDQMIKEFADFFPRIAKSLMALAPEAMTAMSTVDLGESKTEETPS